MNIMKSLFGSLFGAAIGVGIYFAIKQTTGMSYIWFPIVIGVLTGAMAKMLGGSGGTNSARLAAGALAGIIAGVAIFGVDLGPTLFAKPVETGPIRVTDPIDPADRQSDSADEPEEEVKEYQGGSSDKDADAETGDDEAESSESANDENNSDAENQADTDESEKDPASPESDETDPNADRSTNNQEAEERDLNAAMRDRGAAIPGSSDNSKVNSERFAEMIGKKPDETWFSLALPYIFNGIGVLVAYQLARGFGSSEEERRK